MNTVQNTKLYGMPRNLTIIAEPLYEGFKLIPTNGPHVVQYLDRLINVVDAALAHSSKIFAVRVDLHLPQLFDGQPEYSNQLIECFIKSLRAQLDAERQRRLRAHPSVANPYLRYVWAREQALAIQPHYHLLLIFNANFFQQLGGLDRSSGLVNMIFTAWSSAIGLSFNQVKPLVHFCDNPCYFADRTDLKGQAVLLTRASYLCKVETKSWRDGLHAFGASRN